ncbi:hypothetical protein SCFA_290002 [anaerobic digester metagenome]|uniref:Uncharacterized protein n=1 Tax=anaerobic digester metagenome TaxID=1263854 RepID=A0A485LZR5_9ZZZZ
MSGFASPIQAKPQATVGRKATDLFGERLRTDRRAASSAKP